LDQFVFEFLSKIIENRLNEREKKKEKKRKFRCRDLNPSLSGESRVS